MKIAGYDTETTGIAYGDHRIIEVAILTYDLATERLLDRYVQRIHPQRSIDAGAQRVHNIALADLVGEPVWKDVAPEVHRRLAGADLIVAHNGDGFDMPFTNYELARVGLPQITVPTFDTMLQGRFATPNGAVPNLGALCLACGVDYGTGLGKAHAADYDVEVMMQSFFNALRWGAIQLPEEINRDIAIAA